MYKILLGKTEENKKIGDLGVDERIILKRILQKGVERM
jgi:hypothetical protein